jgi:hypothetical protein
MSKLEIATTSGVDNTIIDSQNEQLGEYKQEILIDKKKLKQIQHENFSLSNYSGFKINTLQRLGIKPRNHHLYYGLNIQERALDINITSNKVMIPLLSKKDIQEKLQKIKPEIRNTLGWIHVGAIQIIIKATFKEGIDTPIELAVMDNRIQNREEACLGILRGNLQYGKLKFNIYPRISYYIQDKDFDKTLSLLQDFKRKDFFKQQNRPYSITYAISYAISNTHHSDCFNIKDTIDFPFLFNDVCQIQVPNLPRIEEIDSRPLSLDLQDKPLLSSNQITPRLSFSDKGVVSHPLAKGHNSSRFYNIISEKEDNIRNYKIQGEYFNGVKFSSINILIDTGANGNYINHKLCKHLQKYQLDEPHQYTNFNGELHEINEAIETILKFGEEKIPLRLLIGNENENDTLEVMLGLTFLENVKPYQITSYGLKITFNDRMIYIPK